MPRVSVIIPTYNRAALLREAIQSVLDQTFADFEIIVVDDGSRDETVSVVAGMGDSRVRYVYQVNAGRAAARNHGLSLAQGEFVAFLDDDDMFLPNKLTDQVAELERRPDCGLVVGGWRLVDVDGSLMWDVPPRHHVALGLTHWLHDCHFIVHAPLVRHDWLRRTNGFDKELEPAEDWGLWLYLAHAGCQMCWGSTIVCTYRQHSRNSVRAYTPQMQATVRMLDKYFAHTNLPEEVLAQRSVSYGRIHLFRAVRWFDLGYSRDGKQEFVQALGHCPAWTGTARAELVKLITDCVRNPTLNNSPEEIIAVLLANLPDSFSNQIDIGDAVYNQLDFDDLLQAANARQWGIARSKIVRLGRRGLSNIRPWMLRLYVQSWAEQFAGRKAQ